MKTILHCIDTTGPGGAETVFIDLVANLSVDQFRPVVLIRGKGWVYEELIRRGLKPIILEAKGSFNWRYLRKLVRVIRDNKIDVIQSHLLGSNVYCALAGLITRKPVVATFHGAVDIGANERFKWLKFAAINLGANAIVAVSNSLRENIVNRTPLRAIKTKVIYNGIKTADFNCNAVDTLRNKMGWNEGENIVGSLGNIRTAKAYDVLLQAAALLKGHPRSFRFVIAGQGKGDLYDELLKLKSDLGLDDIVYFLGFNDDPAEFLSNLDFFLLSSSSEGFSIATLQAMAASLPVIATRSGGPQEIITHKENGWLVAPESPALIAGALIKLSNDDVLCHRLAKSGKAHVIENFDVKNMISSYEKIYRAAM
jgi:glycosyltransferase involved in cell wall biosynthesis